VSLKRIVSYIISSFAAMDVTSRVEESVCSVRSLIAFFYTLFNDTLVLKTKQSWMMELRMNGRVENICKKGVTI
jgi:hypothetical protein